MGLAGRVWNTGGGVLIEVETGEIEAFVTALRGEAPPASRIVACAVEELAPLGRQGFEIVESALAAGAFTLTSPDLATCTDCLREIEDPSDRRYRYPFTNCTNCGPRYSITRRVPYDRPNTTMEPFAMCPQCQAEYADPANRRFHAEPNACPVCGPRLSPPLEDAVAALAAGKVVALKSLGGYQLACDALCGEAVSRLRAAKRRSRKPFAIMMRNLAAVERFCHVFEEDRRRLASREAPIVLLRLRDPGAFPPALAPGLREIGAMLPYTPLHHLLLAGPADCLVMTSGNVSEEPIVVSDDEARVKLAPLCDLVVTHDREIFMRVDDSVVRGPSVLRRARGFAPEPVDLGFEAPEVLAVGGELKNAFCLTKGRWAVMSQHIGDLENYETLQFFEETLANLKAVYRAEPRLVAYDLHPDYLSTPWALRQAGPRLAVQHHHAHVAACMAENHLDEKVIGVAFDGTGYGEDGQIWGGEFLLADASGFERASHLRYVPLPGGDRAAREPARMAVSYLRDAFGPGYRGVDLGIPGPRWSLLEQICALPGIQTSSCGRLFDAVSAIAGVCREGSYEGEAAMLLEAAAAEGEFPPYPYQREESAVDTRPLIRAVAEDAASGVGAGAISARFHATLADIIEGVCVGLRGRTGLETVCLSGGTFQSATLCREAERRLSQRGFRVYRHSKVPPNDGGIALGQAFIAARRLQSCA